MSTEINAKHLAVVQGVVNRLVGNSFSPEGWPVTLVSALRVLAGKGADTKLDAVALLRALTFWGLDGQFFAQERLFRRLYARILDPEQQAAAFSMAAKPLTGAGWTGATLSRIRLLFHGALLAAIVGVLIPMTRASARRTASTKFSLLFLSLSLTPSLDAQERFLQPRLEPALPGFRMSPSVQIDWWRNGGKPL